MLYSLLTNRRETYTDYDNILGLMRSGIKVMIFCPKTEQAEILAGLTALTKSSDDRQTAYMSSSASQTLPENPSGTASVSETISLFQKAKLLTFYPLLKNIPDIEIGDGKIGANELNLYRLSDAAPDFNYEQYIVEHADATRDLIIEAGAGTGKTTVMIDRILFLMHTVPNLQFRDIGMITFTNDATANMKNRLQTALMNRFKATGSVKYLNFLEESSGIHIQTIHSFSRTILGELGTSFGFSSSISLRSFQYEKKELILDILNDLYGDSIKPVADAVGLSLYELQKMLLGFWEKMDNAGLTDEDVRQLNWGNPADPQSKVLHATVSSVFEELNRRYGDLKLKKDAVAVSDIVNELRRVITGSASPALKSLNLKYLFVDEFQDSDNAQIQTISWLYGACDLRIFAVGDVKQSIYRFRGAVETAFQKLRSALSRYEQFHPQEFSLVRNYRTSPDVMEKTDEVFRGLEKRKLLEYGKSLTAKRTFPGRYEKKTVYRPLLDGIIVTTVEKCLRDCISVAEDEGKENDPTQHVTCLVRTNRQLRNVGALCRDSGIPCYIKEEGTFYKSEAVRDFYALTGAFLYPDSAEDLFNCAISSYASMSPYLPSVASFAPGSDGQLTHLRECIGNEFMTDCLLQFRIRPALSVLISMVKTRRPAERFAKLRKGQLKAEKNWEEDRLNIQLASEVTQYEANLEKLVMILSSKFTADSATLYQIREFLQINMKSNDSEDCPDISGTLGYGCVYGMTVHKSKGLEFDTVILPYTGRTFRKPVDTEILIDERTDPPCAGWNYVKWADRYKTEIIYTRSNDRYKACAEKEMKDTDREEARLLYVALTRAIRRLEVLVPIGSPEHTWADMLGW